METYREGTIKKHLSFLCQFFAFFCLLPLSSQQTIATRVTSSLQINANVAATCRFTSGSIALAFGAYDPAGSNAKQSKDASASFGMRCVRGTSSKIVIDDGLNPLGGIRRLHGKGDEYLNYQLYTNASRSEIWNRENTVSYVANNVNTKNFSIYGRIPAGQNVGSGTYNDTVTLSVTF